MRWIAKTFTLLLFLLFSVGLDASVLVPETLKNTLASINPDRAELRHNVLFAAGGLKYLYEQRNYEAVWNESTANDFLSNLENAEQQGLNPFDYHLNALRILLVDYSGKIFIATCIVRIGQSVHDSVEDLICRL